MTAGSAAALTLGTAAILAGHDLGRIERLPDCSGYPHEFVIAREQRSGNENDRGRGNEIVSVLSTTIPVLSPSNVGGGFVHLGVTGDQLLDTTGAASLSQFGGPDPVGDGEIFSLNNGTFTRSFEFDNDGNTSGVGPVIVAPSKAKVRNPGRSRWRTDSGHATPANWLVLVMT